MKVEFRMNGLADIQKKMLALKKTIALKVVKDGLKAGATVIRDMARQNLATNGSYYTGALMESVIVRAGKANGPSQMGGFEEWAGVTIAATVYEARLDEGGKVKLVIVKRKAQAPSGAIRPRSYAHLVEFGVRPHATGKGSKLDEVVIVQGPAGKKGRRTKRTVLTGRAGAQVGRGHPGFAAKPFMRPAFDYGKLQANADLVATVRRRLEEEIAPWTKETKRRRP